MALMTTAYDKLDWHSESAVNAGQPAEHAFTHIGLYLAWLIRHDLHNPDLIGADWADSVKAGEMTGSDLADAIDGKLVGDAMTPEGRAFSDSYYETYLQDYEEAFAGVPAYGIPDDAASYERVTAFLDDRYWTWLTEGGNIGSPALRQGSPSPESGVAVPLGAEAPPTDEQLAELEDLLAATGFRIEEPPGPEDMPHEARDLEELLPRQVTDPPMGTWSVRATDFASSLVNRALKRLAIQPRDVYVVIGLGGERSRTLSVDLYAVPGVRADRLEEEFRSTIHLPTGGHWIAREVAGKEVNWADGLEFKVAYWTIDGLVLHVAGADTGLIEEAIGQLP
jgi:hypothetical protein